MLRCHFTASMSKILTVKRYNLSKKSLLSPQKTHSTRPYLELFAFTSPLWFGNNHTYYFLSLSGAVIKVPLILLAFTSRFINVQRGLCGPAKC